MQLDISSLKETKGKSIDFRFEEIFAPLELGGKTMAFKRPVIVEGTATNVESGILVECTIDAETTINCDRCLKPVNFTIQASAVEQYVKSIGTETSRHGDVFGKDFYTFKGTIIDLRDFVEENVFLNIPMKTLCAEGCKGICPSCGADLNCDECQCYVQDTDPRMQKLKEWFQEYGGREE